MPISEQKVILMSSKNYLSSHECQNFNMWEPVIFIVQWCSVFQETSSSKIFKVFLILHTSICTPSNSWWWSWRHCLNQKFLP